MDLRAIRAFAQGVLAEDTTGHDWLHALRVENNARKISPPQLEREALEVIQAACWLHDTIDEKLAAAQRQTPAQVKQVLLAAEAAPAQVEDILDIIQNLSYSKNLEKKKALSFSGQIVQDADRLDAIGAIGIARAFYYGGSQGDPLYTEDRPRAAEELTEENYRNHSSVVNHFYEKLLLLEEQMNTDGGKLEAKKRTDFMRVYLEQLSREI